MFVNEISSIDSTLVQRQTLVELQQRATEDRLAHEVLRERQGGRSLRSRLGELFAASAPAPRRTAHRHAH